MALDSPERLFVGRRRGGHAAVSPFGRASGSVVFRLFKGAQVSFVCVCVKVVYGLCEV